MDTKLTLNIDRDVLHKAKSYARKRGRSLSGLVENYFKALTGKTEVSDTNLTPKVKSMLGSYKLPKDFDYKKELSEQLSGKYK
ncbi:MAG: hypothetical protein AMS27_12200 [Bacteroides sp. SM23_62_1]|nr:MAG: hypothetical protein AMS27_12200 [Bacteroides sp. SM23_62_1]